MEKPNFGGNGGGIKLPIGYRFHPTDEELLVHYLRRKVFGFPLPASVIPELDVFQADPWSLPGDLKEKRYFFSRKWGNDSEKRCKRAAGSGYWKPIGKGRQIIASFDHHLIGIRRTLIFCQGNNHSNNDFKTQWVMHEYRLVTSATIPNTTHQVSKMKLGLEDWVVHRVFQRKRRPKKERIFISKSSKTSKIQTTMEESFDIGPPQLSSPCSSGITNDHEVSSCGLLDEEEISSFSFHSCMRKT